MNWLLELHKTHPVAHAISALAFVSMAGMALGSLKIRGIGLGTAGVLFAGIIIGHFGAPVDHGTLDFVKEFGLILFVVILKVLAHVVGVIISVINFTTYFNTKKWFYGQVYEMIRYYPDHESYLEAYKQSLSPVRDRMIT